MTHDPRMATWTPTARTLSQPAANSAHSRCSMNGLIDSYHFCRCHCWTAVREQNAGGLLTEERRRVSPAPLCADSPTRGLAQAPTSLHTHAPRSSVVWTLQQAPAPAPSTHPPLHLSPAPLPLPRSTASIFESSSPFLPFPRLLSRPCFIFCVALMIICKYVVNCVTVAFHPRPPECRSVRPGGPSVQGSPWHQWVSAK